MQVFADTGKPPSALHGQLYCAPLHFNARCHWGQRFLDRCLKNNHWQQLDKEGRNNKEKGKMRKGGMTL